MQDDILGKYSDVPFLALPDKRKYQRGGTKIQ